MSQRLIIEDDEGTTTIVPLGKDAITIGRQQGNTIQLTEKNVSRRHARLYPDQTAWVIEDLASYNGIKVNGVPIDGRVILKEGDVVQIGDYHLALTEDVDKRTLNYQGAVAANDGAPAMEPMLASSSTDLPRLSAEELAALQSGPHAVSQPALMDSGPVPATPMGGYEERKKGGAGVLVGFGLVVAIALVGGIGWMAMNSGKDNQTPTQVARADEKATPAKAADNAPPPIDDHADAKAEEAVPTPVEPEPENAAAEGGGAPEAAEGGAVPAEAAEGGDEAEVVVPDEAPAEEPSNDAAKKRNTSKPKTKTAAPKKDTSAPPPPPTPAVDVAAMLSEARKAAMRSPAQGYELASKAYKAGGGREAAKLVATCACRMGDANKAKTALKRLKGADRDSVAAICRDKGIAV
jgi:hypothetical protein